MLIRNAEILGHGFGDLRVERDRITAIGAFTPRPEERVIEAHGGLLLPGLHDHHIHLAGLAAMISSVPCGPPDVRNEFELAIALSSEGSGWIRGVGYDESVLGGLPDAPALDRLQCARPVRIQHRTGRMWLFNSAAMELLLASGEAPPAGLERNGSVYTGRLFDEDAWLQRALGSAPPEFADVSALLAACGVTGITDMSPRNGIAMAAHFGVQFRAGILGQAAVLCGAPELADADPDGWRLGPLKLHLHEAALPDFDDTISLVKHAHANDRPVAVHCVTEVELVFALAVLDNAGAMAGDRIEHISVAAPHLIEMMADFGLHGCVQPHFIAERGDRYLATVEAHHHADLYRLQSLIEAGIPLASGSDAPYGTLDPWNAMAAAVSRQTLGGQTIGTEEALPPEDALSLYLADPLDLTCQRKIEVGADADLCLIDRPWDVARQDLAAVDVIATIASGCLIYDGVDHAPVQRLTR